MTFTQFLLQNEYASLAELEEASQATVLYGGRLGTALIELGLMTPEQLDSALARHHDLPAIPAEWLAKPDAAARAALHVDLVKRHRTFPLNFEKRSLHVGMVDPRNEAILDDIAFASGCLVVPYALAEFRFVQLMHRVYGVAPSTRFKTLLDEGARARVFGAREQQRARTADELRAHANEDLEIGPLAADLSDGADAFFLSTPALPLVPREAAPPAPALAPTAAPLAPNKAAALAGPAAPPALEIDDTPILLDRRATRVALERFERTLAGSNDRAQLIAASIGLAARFAETVVLFVVRGGVATGLAAMRGEEEIDVESTLVPLQAGSALTAVCETRTFVRALPTSALDKLLAKALRAAEDAELAVYPVTIGERVVNLLVAQPQSGVLAATAHAALEALAPQLGAAYERLIREQKQKARATASVEPKPVLKAAIGALPLQKRIVRVPAKG